LRVSPFFTNRPPTADDLQQTDPFDVIDPEQLDRWPMKKSNGQVWE
jgi:hypothetical protein